MLLASRLSPMWAFSSPSSALRMSSIVGLVVATRATCVVWLVWVVWSIGCVDGTKRVGAHRRCDAHQT